MSLQVMLTLPAELSEAVIKDAVAKRREAEQQWLQRSDEAKKQRGKKSLSKEAQKAILRPEQVTYARVIRDILSRHYNPKKRRSKVTKKAG